ncbi:telomerase reverse transcriptase isoform X2 [Nymphaea colorata]|uniref:telomerase reverse transcriptase isoform X2 n=1 Tax=Nymphaea colorata TaxID=210225 RepID=UPI00214F31F9|nr:telomerase reverse transcriptase isoform X2 [Nymphaea colorata]
MGDGGNGDGVGSGKKVGKKRWRRAQRCPKALRRAYGKRVRSLLEAIVSLLPPPKKSEECRCRGGGCLGCADNPAFFILREADDVEYRKLLTRGFAVLPEDVIPLTEFLPDNRRTQIQVVRNTIELLIVNTTKKCSNVICFGYEKYTQCSHVVDILCMLPWSLLLSRIGDFMMFRLLSCASIFLHIARNDYLQVTGTPMNEFLWSSMTLDREVSSQSRIQHQSLMACPTQHAKVSDHHLVHKDANGRFMHISSVKTSKCQHLTTSIISEHFKVTAGKQRKRNRPFSWQRKKKQKQKRDPCDEHELVTLPIANKDDKISMGMDVPELSMVDSYGKRKFSDCFMRFTPQKPNGSKLINRRQVFYDSNIHQTVLPSGHILLRLKPNNRSAIDLINHVFCVSDFDSKAVFPSVPEDGNNSLFRKSITVLDLFKTMIRNAKRCQFVRLLERHCPIHPAISSQNQSHEHVLKESAIGFPSTNSGFKIEASPLIEPSGKEEIASGEAIRLHEAYDMNKSFSKHKEVVSFIWAVCRNVVPSPLLGHPCNWRALRQNIANFVKLRRFEKFYLKHCMHQVWTSGFPFLSEFTSICHWHAFRNEELITEAWKDCDLSAMKSSLHRKLVEVWIFWLFSCLIVPVLRANFYITESENGRHGVFYYRKVLWKKIMKKYIDNLQNENFQLLDASACASASEKLFYPKVRFLPKENGVRPLVSYKSSYIPISRFSSCNLGNITNKQVVMSPKAAPHEVKCCCAKNGKKYLTSSNLQATAKHSPFPYPMRDDIRDLYVILKGIKLDNPDLLGSSVFDYNDIYRKFYHFLASLRRKSLSLPRVFIVACDVSKAFDSVDQEKLLHVMDDILQKQEYHLRKYVQVRCSKRSLVVHHDHLLVNHGKCSYSILASKQSGASHSILVDQASTRRIGRDELLVFLSKHIRKNIWRLDGKLYLHEIGIPQGSMISSFLCSSYYGHLERNIIFPLLGKCSVPLLSECQRASKMEEMIGSFNSDKGNTDETSSCHGVRKTNSLGEKIKQLQVNYAQGRLSSDSQDKFAPSSSFLLLRLIDDFLFISSSMEQAASFFLRMYEGFEEYNCCMNSKKFCMNFDLLVDGGAFPQGTYMGDDGVTFIPWSGLLVNCHTLEVQADYTRYWGVHLSSTLTVWRSPKPGHHLKAKLCDYMRPKCHALLYDSNINSPAVVRLNAYQAFLLCAMKFHCYVSSMPSGMLFSPTYFLEMIENSISYTFKLIQKRIHCVRSEKGLNPILQLKKKEVKWLGFSAYIRALKKKQSRYKELLVHLRSRLQACSGATLSCELRYAVEDSHSSAFWKIKY